jgi:hypothetical protein
VTEAQLASLLAGREFLPLHNLTRAPVVGTDWVTIGVTLAFYKSY